MKKQVKEQRLVSLSVLAGILFCFPVMAIFNSPELVWGIPTLYLYIFILWAILIAVLLKMVNKNRNSGE